MKVPMTREQKALHERAVELCRQYRLLEWQIIEVLQKIDRTKTYLVLGSPSLFQYAVQMLGLTESVAYNFISVARKAAEVPELREALAEQKISVAKAGRVVSVLDQENARAMIEFARTHSKRDVEHTVAKINPKMAVKEVTRAIDTDSVAVTVMISRKTLEDWKRSQSLLAQATGQSPNLGKTLETVLAEHIERRDPVHKAKRALDKDAKRALKKVAEELDKKMQDGVSNPQLCPGRVSGEGASKVGRARAPLTASQKHNIFARDEGCCTFIDAKGNRCSNDRWLHIHHLRPVTYGGGNDPQNLTTLCSVHHDLTHQLTLPIEGQVTWLREPKVNYG